MTINRQQSARPAIFCILFALFGLLIACGGSTEQAAGKATPSKEASGSRGAVTMKLIQFKPATLEVAAGAEVAWTQTDAGFHTVTSGTVEQGTGGVTPRPDGRFDSSRLATDQTFSFTFDEPGAYPYYCSIHPATMRGEVRVRG